MGLAARKATKRGTSGNVACRAENGRAGNGERLTPVTWVLDLDGVVWRGNEPIVGSVEAIKRLQDAGKRVAYVTNNSASGSADQVVKLAAMGIAANIEDVVSARDLLVERIGTGKTVMCSVAPGLARAIEEAGNRVLLPEQFIGDETDLNSVVDPPDVDVVVAGQRFDVTYLQLSVTTRALLQCGKLLAPNRDRLYPHSSGMLLGTGSIVATLETASGVTAEILGKPEQPIVDAMLKRLPDAVIVVGDQLSTDGELARRANVAFGFVTSGVDGRRAVDSSDTPIAHSAESLSSLVEALL